MIKTLYKCIHELTSICHGSSVVIILNMVLCVYLRIYLSMCVCFNLLESLHDPCQYLSPCFSEPSNFERISKSFPTMEKHVEC